MPRAGKFPPEGPPGELGVGEGGFWKPDPQELLPLVRVLLRAGVRCALGGSGLLLSLGLVDRVGDWDLTTDAPLERVEAALQGWQAARVAGGRPPHASNYVLRVALPGTAAR